MTMTQGPVPVEPRRPIFARLWSRLMPAPRQPEERTVPFRLVAQHNAFYGWYDDPTQHVDQPTYDPPHDGPCLYCGRRIHADDVRTHSIMWAGPVYANRSYFYRTHASCDETAHGKGLTMDGVIWDMIARNGD